VLPIVGTLTVVPWNAVPVNVGGCATRRDCSILVLPGNWRGRSEAGLAAGINANWLPAAELLTPGDGHGGPWPGACPKALAQQAATARQQPIHPSGKRG
jgi:hypothetical protein